MTLADVFSPTAGKKFDDLMKLCMGANIEMHYKNMMQNMNMEQIQAFPLAAMTAQHTNVTVDQSIDICKCYEWAKGQALPKEAKEMLNAMSGVTPYEMAVVMAKAKGGLDLAACLAVPMGDILQPPREYDGEKANLQRKLANNMFAIMSTHFNDKVGL